MSSVFGTGQSMNSMAWKLAKWAEFVLVLTNTHVQKIKNLSEQNFEGTVAYNYHDKRKKTHDKKKHHDLVAEEKNN